MSELLSAFGLSNASAVSLNDLEMMCPAILNQVLLPACPYTSPSNHNDSSLLLDHKGEYDYHKCLHIGGSDNQMCCMEPGKYILRNEEIGRAYNKTSEDHINLFYHFIRELQIDFIVFILDVQCIYHCSETQPRNTHFCVIMVLPFFLMNHNG